MFCILASILSISFNFGVSLTIQKILIAFEVICSFEKYDLKTLKMKTGKEL